MLCKIVVSDSLLGKDFLRYTMALNLVRKGTEVLFLQFHKLLTRIAVTSGSIHMSFSPEAFLGLEKALWSLPYCFSFESQSNL